MGKGGICKVSKKRIALLAITALSILFVLLCRWNTGIAEWYMQYVYPVFAVTLSYISNIFPFSLFDALTIAATLIFLLSIVQLFRRKLRFLRWLYLLGMSTIWIVLWFYLAWGISYYRADYYTKFAVLRTTTSIEDFSNINFCYIDSLNKYYTPISQIDTKEISRSIEQSYCQLHKQLKLPYPNGKRSPKRTMYQKLMTKAGVTGFYAPFFSEVHVNTDPPPVSYPFTLAHEKAHQLGIASESECNLYAIIVCTSSDHPQVRYSGYYELVSYLLSALWKAAPEEVYNEAYSRISADVIADFDNARTFWRYAISPKLAELQAKVYDSYLKSNKVESGIVSYSEVVELFLSWEQHKHSVTPK